MTHKNPFEIRAEMLHLAKDYMDTQQQMNIQFANDMYEQGKKNMQDAVSYTHLTLPTIYSV